MQRVGVVVGIAIALAAATASAQPAGGDEPETVSLPLPPVLVTPPDPARPRAGTLSFDLEIPMDMTFAGSTTWLGGGGLELGAAYRLTDRLSVGVTGTFEGVVPVGASPGSSPEPAMRLRAGGLARYFVHLGPMGGVWLGARGGYETLDGGSTRGTYADVSVGIDWWAFVMQTGLYVAAGVSVEPASAYGASSTDAIARTSGPPPASAPAAIDAPYVVFGWHLAFH